MKKGETWFGIDETAGVQYTSAPQGLFELAESVKDLLGERMPCLIFCPFSR